ncbi:MAG: DEAD/DEAH box helicase family protein [Gammaproteobacteria bacterium]|nr:DEAD/DEAH box helicase family protein [Gammaproteobacteria bacterium]
MTSAYRWRHQEEAVNEFLEEGHGILTMATGTGKTRTSLKILNRLLREDEVDNVVVATYGNDLLDQWYNTRLENFSADEMWIYKEYGGNHDLGSFLTKNRDKLEGLIISYDNLHELHRRRYQQQTAENTADLRRSTQHGLQDAETSPERRT